MKVTIDSSVKEKIESVRLGCLVYNVKVKEKNEDLWEKLENEIFPQLISIIEEKGINGVENIFSSKKHISL